MVFPTFQRDSGYAGNVNCHRSTPLYAFQFEYSTPLLIRYQFCVLCPNEGGAFKQTSTGAWAHLLCAMYISETTVGNAAIQEPIEGVDKIEKARWKLVGCCIIF